MPQFCILFYAKYTILATQRADWEDDVGRHDQRNINKSNEAFEQGRRQLREIGGAKLKSGEQS